MDQTDKPFDLMELTEYGINVQAGLERFMGKEAIYKKCLVKFIDDKTLEKLIQAMEDGEHIEIDNAAHSLAGVAGNLSMESLHAALSTFRSQLKEGNLDNELFKKILSIHESILQKLKDSLL